MKFNRLFLIGQNRLTNESSFSFHFVRLSNCKFDSIRIERTMEIEQEEEETKTTEERGYLARDEYTSERFKLELANLPKYFGFGVS